MVFANPVYSVETFFLKDGYELKKVFCDSYSISDSVLLSLAAAVVLAGNSESSESLSLTDIALDEDKIHKGAKELLSVRAQYHLPSGIKEIRENGIKLWNNCVHEIKMKDGKYHPKLILACFRKKDDECKWFYRLQVGSANLTAMSGFETAVIVEGTTTENGAANGSALKEFYEKVFVFDRLKCTFPEELEALDTVEFISPESPAFPKGYEKRSHIGNIRFAYTFPKEISENCFKKVLIEETENCSDLHVYSPFMKFDGNGNQYLSNKLNAKTISYYTNLTQEIFENKSNIKKKLYCAEKDSSLFLHAKVYVIKEFRIWQGSANASESGFEKNVEFMIGADMAIEENASSNFSDMKSFIYKDSACSLGISDPKVEFTTLSEIQNSEWAFTDPESTFIVNTAANAFKAKAQVQDKILLSVDVDYTKLDDKIGSVELLDRKDNVIYSYKRAQGKHTLYTFLDKDCFCYGGQMVARVKLKETDEPLITLIPVEIVGETALDTEPVSLMELVDEWKCRDAIPKCKEKGFSSVNDDVYRRLRAYVASYGVEKKKECYQKCLERIKKLGESLKDDKKCYMSAAEQKMLRCLKDFLGKAGATDEQ